MHGRLFYYTDAWAADRLGLPGPEPRPQVQWWDDDGETEDVEELVDIVPTWGQTSREELDGFVETFVIGRSRASLIRKQGFGSEPPFRRMRHPRDAVVEMRTINTRTFGFFSKVRIYVAMRVDLTKNTHADNDRLYEVYGDYVLQRLRHVNPSDVDNASDVESLIGD